jgi:tripartite-type tricarboxylate transporter receptor subunit TctC
VLAALFPQAAHTAVPAQPDFYKGKAVTLITSTGVGGTYDLIARLVARHMPRYIPGNPTMVVQNMPGAGNVLATNYMYNSAPKDAPASRSSTMPFRCIR